MNAICLEAPAMPAPAPEIVARWRRVVVSKLKEQPYRWTAPLERAYDLATCVESLADMMAKFQVLFAVKHPKLNLEAMLDSTLDHYADIAMREAR